MKKLFLICMLLFLAGTVLCQKTLVVERIGTLRKYGFNEGDIVKLKVKSTRQVLKSYLTELKDSSVTIGQFHKVQLNDIGTVYKSFGFPKRLAYNLFLAGGIFFVATTVNGLINHEQVFNETNLIVTGSILAAATISLVLSEKAMRIGLHWKVKILDIPHL